MTRLKPRRSLPSLRRWLLKVHRDLLAIHGAIDLYAAYRGDTLSLFERMVLVLEDRRFFRHGGFDAIAIVREAAKALVFRGHGGASTIDMQFVRTVTDYRAATVRRKVYEILLSSVIQFRYSKTTLLRSYLDIAFFGSHLVGSERAAAALFGKPTSLLNQDEAAQLASMLVFPRPLNPGPEWQRKVSRRANYIKAVYVRYKKRFDKLESRKRV
jgi:membrane peptidoglycan carboxypeptidase